MDEINYYNILGVPEDATLSDIKRAYIRKQKEFRDDETMQDKLNQAYTVLTNENQRRDYNNSNKYGNKLTELWDRYHDTESSKEARGILVELKNLYKQMESEDKTDIYVLKKLFEIEQELGDENELPYLNSIMNIVSTSEDLENRREWFRYLGSQFELYDKVDDAIKAYFQIYKMDASDDSICDLIDLLYREKHNTKASIQILNDCINRVEDKALKAKYLSKTFEVVSSLDGDNYDKVKKILYTKLNAFTKEEEPQKTAIAVQIALIMGQCLDNDRLDCYDELDKIFNSFNIENEDTKLIYKALQEFRTIIDNNKYHECIKLLSEDIWTEKLRRKMEVLMLNEMEEIKASIDYFKKYAPTMWNLNLENNQNIESLVNRLYPLVTEYGKLVGNQNLGKELKNMLRAIAFEGIVRFSKVENEFASNRDIFFSDEHIEKSRQELRLLERLYPASYQRFSDIFFDGKSTKELFGDESRPSNISGQTVAGKKTTSVNKKVFYSNAAEGYEHKPYISGILEIIVLVVVFFCFPPAIPLIFIFKYIKRHEKNVKKVWRMIKPILIIVCVIAVIGGLFKVGSSVKDMISMKNEQKYEENHNIILTDEELDKRDKINDKYAGKTSIDISVKQISYNSNLEYPNQSYVWLVLNIDGYNNSYELHSNCLTDDEYNTLFDKLQDLYDSDDTDYEVCEEFYKEAYNITREIKASTENDELYNAEYLTYTLDMNMLWYELYNNASTDDVIKYMKEDSQDEKDYGVETYGKSQTVSVNGKCDNHVGELRYTDYFDETGSNIFEWKVDDSFTIDDVMNMFNVSLVDDINSDCDAKFLWKNKMYIKVYFNGDGTYFEFSLN